MSESKAMELLIDNLKWRYEQQLTALTEDDLAELYRTYSFYSVLHDKLGREVYFIPVKYVDCAVVTRTREFSKKTTKFVHHLMEQVYKKVASNITGKLRVGLLLLYDLKDSPPVTNFNAECLALIGNACNEGLHRFPGGMDEMFAVNADAFGLSTGNIIKRMLPGNFQNQVRLYDEDDSVWMSELKKVIEPKNMPPDLYVRSQDPTQQKKNGDPSYLKVFGQNEEDNGTNKEKPKKKRLKMDDDDDDDDDDEKMKNKRKQDEVEDDVFIKKKGSKKDDDRSFLE